MAEAAGQILQQQQQQQINVDELAREKVQEVETLLDSTENLKLGVINSSFSVLKQIITAADLHRTNDKNDNRANFNGKSEIDESIYADYADDNEQFNAVDLSEQFATNSVKWTIRVKAFKLVHRLVRMFGEHSIYHNSKTNNPLFKLSNILRHLPDLVRLSFVAATSPYDDLKLQGFEMFKFVINRFALIEEKEFPGHSIMEQYRAQVLSALKPAFHLDAPPYITAIASQVCCLWICRGLERDPANLKRTYQLMMSTINKLENQSINQNSKLYTESELEQERLDIIGSWAELYITVKMSSSESDSLIHETSKLPATSRVDIKLLNKLVEPQVVLLIDKWWEALKDYALLIIPAPKIKEVSHDNEHVYTKEVALRLFGPVWPKLVLATTIWLCLAEPYNHDGDQKNSSQLQTPLENDINQNCDKFNRTSKVKYFKFICGILMKELCRFNSVNHLQTDSLPEDTMYAIRSISLFVKNEEMRLALVDDLAVAQEFYTILYSFLINNTKFRSQQYLFLKGILDNIFDLVLTKVVERPDYIRYSLAHLIDSATENLANIANAIKTDHSLDLEKSRTRFSTRLGSIVAIIKTAPNIATDKSDLLDALKRFFQAILCFEADFTLGTNLLTFLKDIYLIIPLEYVSAFLEDIILVKIDVVSSLINPEKIEKPVEKGHAVSPTVEAYMKSICLALDACEAGTRLKLMNSYLDTLLKVMPRKLETSNSEDSIITPAVHEQGILDLGLKYIADLRQKFPEDFKTCLIDERRNLYDSALELQKDIEAEIKKKRDAQVAKIPSNAANSIKQPRAKIVLKADFSNFYAKKS